MSEVDSRSRFPLGVLFETYARYAGEPESRREVYGYWAFIFGSLVAFVGVLVFLVGPTRPPTIDYGVREAAIALAAFGLPVALFGISLLLPLNRAGVAGAAAGLVVALLGVGGFVSVYPDRWVVTTPDHSGVVISVYTAGVAVTVGVAALVPVVTGERSLFLQEAYEREREYPAVAVGEALRGGLYSVFRSDGEWNWRFIEQDALAGGTAGTVSRIETEEAVERVRRQVGEAGLLEIKSAAFRLYEGADDLWRWMLMRADGSVVADSGETFDDRDAAAASITELKDYGPGASLLEIEGAAFSYDTEAGDWRWSLVDENRDGLLSGAAGHDSRGDAERAAEAVRGRAADAAVLAIETFGVELFEADGGWRWRLLGADEAVVLEGEESFDSRRSVESAVYDLLDDLGSASVFDRGDPVYEVTPSGTGWEWRLTDGSDGVLARGHGGPVEEAEARQQAGAMRADAADAAVVRIEETDFEYYRRGDGWHWRLVTTDRETVAESAAGFENAEAVEAGIERVRVQATAADLIEYEDAAFQVYETDGEWRWRLIDEDGNVLTDSGAEHDSREDAMSSMLTVKQNAPNAELLEIETAAFELFERDGRWNWRLVDEGGETTAQGGTWHDSREAAREAMDQLAGRAPESRSRAMEGSVFHLYADGEDWRWRFVRPDGTAIAESATAYGTRDEAEVAIEERVRPNAGAADIHTTASVAIQHRQRGDRWEWRVRDAERRELARSTEYPSREAASEAVDSVKTHAGDATVFERKDTAVLLTRGGARPGSEASHTGEAPDATDPRDGAGEWRWKLVDEDRTALATGGGGFATRADAEAAVERVQSLLPEAGTLEYEDAAFELSEVDGRWQWRLVDEDEAVIAAGTEGYDSREAAAAGVDAVKGEVTDASILEIDTAAFELHEDAGEWRWRLVDTDGTSLAESAVSYPSRRAASDAMNAVKEFGSDSTIEVAQ